MTLNTEGGGDVQSDDMSSARRASHRMPRVDVTLDEAAHLLLLPGPWIIDLSPPVPQRPPFATHHVSWLARHSAHFWSGTNQAREETYPTAIHAWLVLPMYVRGQQKRSRMDFISRISPVCWWKTIRDTWTSSVFCVIDQQEWLSVSRGNYIVINRFKHISLLETDCQTVMLPDVRGVVGRDKAKQCWIHSLGFILYEVSHFDNAMKL